MQAPHVGDNLSFLLLAAAARRPGKNPTSILIVGVVIVAMRVLVNINNNHNDTWRPSAGMQCNKLSANCVNFQHEMGVSENQGP